MTTALITGITGQDGSFLTELLLNKGYTVHGIIRRSSSFNTGRIDHLYDNPNLKLHYGDLTDGNSLFKILEDAWPDEVYHLGAQSHVRVSFDIPIDTSEIDAIGTIRLLEAIRTTGVKTKFYNACSSEMFGSAPAPQCETTIFHPRSPYGCAKVFSYHQAVNYREAYGMFVCNGILFNHESERRGETFVTRKITRGLARIRFGLQKKLLLGNIRSKRDWGYAGDYVKAMWLMLQQPRPDDYVIATGEQHSVQEFLELAAQYHNIDWKDVVETDPRYFRPSEVDSLCGLTWKAERQLGWHPETDFEDLVNLMCHHDTLLAEQEVKVKLCQLKS